MNNTNDLQAICQLLIEFEATTQDREDKPREEAGNKPKPIFEPYVFYVPMDCR